MKKVMRTSIIAWLIALVACSKNESSKEHAAPASSQAKTSGPTKEVRLDPKVIRDAKIKAVRVVREMLLGTIDLRGEIASDPDKTAQISCPVAGTLEQVSFKEGAQVKAGDVLAIVRVPELGRIRGAFASAEARSAATRNNAERLQRLREKGFAAEQDYLNAEAEARSAEADMRGLKEQLGTMGTAESAAGSRLSLRSRIAGTVVARQAVVGQPINPNQTIGTVADLRTVWFLAKVFEKNVAEVRLGMNARVELQAFPNETFQGQVRNLSKQLDPTTKTLTARIELDNARDVLRLGLFGTAHISNPSEGGLPSLVVPRGAVIDVDGRPVAFVRRAADTFEVRELSLGESARDLIEIKKGLADGEEVVAEGGFTLKSAILKATFAESEE